MPGAAQSLPGDEEAERVARRVEHYAEAVRIPVGGLGGGLAPTGGEDQVDGGPEVVDLDLEDRRNLALETRLRRLEVRLYPAVELGSDPETGKAAPGQPDGSLRRVADEVADSGADRSAGGVDDDRHAFRRRR